LPTLFTIFGNLNGHTYAKLKKMVFNRPKSPNYSASAKAVDKRAETYFKIMHTFVKKNLD